MYRLSAPVVCVALLIAFGAGAILLQTTSAAPPSQDDDIELVVGVAEWMMMDAEWNQRFESFLDTHPDVDVSMMFMPPEITELTGEELHAEYGINILALPYPMLTDLRLEKALNQYEMVDLSAYEDTFEDIGVYRYEDGIYAVGFAGWPYKPIVSLVDAPLAAEFLAAVAADAETFEDRVLKLEVEDVSFEEAVTRLVHEGLPLMIDREGLFEDESIRDEALAYLSAIPEDFDLDDPEMMELVDEVYWLVNDYAVTDEARYSIFAAMDVLQNAAAYGSSDQDTALYGYLPTTGDPDDERPIRGVWICWTRPDGSRDCSWIDVPPLK